MAGAPEDQIAGECCDQERDWEWDEHRVERMPGDLSGARRVACGHDILRLDQPRLCHWMGLSRKGSPKVLSTPAGATALLLAEEAQVGGRIRSRALRAKLRR